jgi:hypothetical protein
MQDVSGFSWYKPNKTMSMKTLSDIYALEFSFENDSKAVVVIAGVKGEYVYAMKKKSIPNFDVVAPSGTARVGCKAGLIDGNTVKVFERIKKTKSEQELWKEVGNFTPSKVEKSGTRINYWT